MRAVALLADLLNRYGFKRGQRVWCLTPLSHRQGLSGLLFTFAFGGTLILCPATEGRAMWQSVQESNPDWLLVVPTLLARLAEAAPDSAGEYTILSGLAPLSPDLLPKVYRKFGNRVFNAFGTTETGPIALATPSDLQTAPRSVGRPLCGVKVELRGEMLWISSPLTAGGAWCTGDLGQSDELGRLYLQGRADDCFVCGGTINPAVLERRIMSLDGVRECAVWPVPHDEYGQAIHALLVLEKGACETQVRAQLAASLPRTLRPQHVFWASELPRNAGGKLMRRQLPANQ